ncbi:MAG: formylglycine-generating enzyme family protein [Planctomycetia bacterium]|nr:formylglycine-generating enzyme family protein [Planctomycetia bacterium]
MLFEFRKKISPVIVLLLTFTANACAAYGQESALKHQGTEPGERVTLDYEGVELAFRWCPVGSFTMGSPESESHRFPDPWEKPHNVTLTSGFWMLETEVTQKLFQLVLNSNPSFWKADDRPVEMIGMPTCVHFCHLFAEKTGLDAKLPTEAQWEYACRAGTSTAYSWGDSPNAANLCCRKAGPNPENQTAGTVPVRSFAPNPWGLCDMHGNVAEWVIDPFDPEYYSIAPETDPTGPTAGADRIVRGGGWSSLPEFCRSASRNLDVEPYSLSSSYGFRFIVVPKP